TLIPAPGSMGGQTLYPMNPWAVVPSFREAELTEECVYRDYPRAVFTREDGARLYVDPKTAYPVKLDVVEPHYLWGTGPRGVPHNPQFGDVAVHVKSARSAHVLNGRAYGSSPSSGWVRSMNVVMPPSMRARIFFRAFSGETPGYCPASSRPGSTQ